MRWDQKPHHQIEWTVAASIHQMGDRWMANDSGEDIPRAWHTDQRRRYRVNSWCSRFWAIRRKAHSS